MKFLRELWRRHFHSQENIFGGRDWSFMFNWRGRRMYFFRSQIHGWSNLSETHTSPDCYDPYCQWHGNL